MACSSCGGQHTSGYCGESAGPPVRRGMWYTIGNFPALTANLLRTRALDNESLFRQMLSHALTHGYNRVSARDDRDHLVAELAITLYPTRHLKEARAELDEEFPDHD